MWAELWSMDKLRFCTAFYMLLYLLSTKVPAGCLLVICFQKSGDLPLARVHLLPYSRMVMRVNASQWKDEIITNEDYIKENTAIL
ncbi:hypothetical protein EX30DRAFT_343549 [Ascodesmis nigricans]|uniref:Uncharacterized protein n=1 Tax=Ascodesmis nigricans TaxID=341454 RepID=A0A4S2MM27_9PEZI|nr:hypothetical protein EX30DRAFT_343549 [Ascodesmis nigricans]